MPSQLLLLSPTRRTKRPHMSYLPKSLSRFTLVALVAGCSGYAVAGSKEIAAAHAKAARQALVNGDTKLAAKELAKAKRVFKQRAKVQEALDAVEAQLQGCTTDADCEEKFGKEP